MSRPLTNNRHRTFSETVSDWLHYQDYQLVSWLFIRALGAIYLIAFASLTPIIFVMAYGMVML